MKRALGTTSRQQENREIQVNRFAVRLRKARIALGMRREDVVEGMGYSVASLRKLERGEVIRTRKLSALSERLQIPLIELLSLQEDAWAQQKDAEANAAGIQPAIESFASDENPSEQLINTNVARVERVTVPDWLGSEPASHDNLVPIRGRANAAGESGRIIMLGEISEWVEPPNSIKGVENAYIMYVHGTSMEPRYFPGERVWVHPHKPMRAARFCVVLIGDPGEPPTEAYIKEFVKETDTELVVRQYNPPRDLHFPLDRVVGCHRIVGSDES
ncbi:MAG: XRE family transcriptional regulator [Xanthobacteraceae bacterium]